MQCPPILSSCSLFPPQPSHYEVAYSNRKVVCSTTRSVNSVHPISFSQSRSLDCEKIGIEPSRRDTKTAVMPHNRSRKLLGNTKWGWWGLIVWNVKFVTKYRAKKSRSFHQPTEALYASPQWSTPPQVGTRLNKFQVMFICNSIGSSSNNQFIYQFSPLIFFSQVRKIFITFYYWPLFLWKLLFEDILDWKNKNFKKPKILVALSSLEGNSHSGTDESSGIHVKPESSCFNTISGNA